MGHVGVYVLKIEFLLNLSKQIQKYRRKQVQNLAEVGEGEVISISYSYYVATEYIYPYDVLQGHYVEFVYENDILMRNWAEFIYTKLTKKLNK